MFVVGITGGIGSGKTTVSNLFSELGVPVIDADIIAREIVEPGQPALSEIAREFGDDVLLDSGELDRAALRKIVFSAPEKRIKLEAITHPAIRRRMEEHLDNVKGPYAIKVIPLLIDTGHWESIDRVLVVDVEDQTQKERVMERDGLNEKEVMNILDAQVSREERLSAADDIIVNDHGIEHLRKEVAHYHALYTLEAENYAAERETPVAAH